MHRLADGVAVSDGTLAQIVVQAAEAVDGAHVRRPRRGLEIAVEDGRARVQLELAARYGVVLPELGRAVQASVAGALRTMCGLAADTVELTIEEIR